MAVRKDYETCGAHNPFDQSIHYNRETHQQSLQHLKRQELCLIYITLKFLSHVMDTEMQNYCCRENDSNIFWAQPDKL